MEVCVNKKEFDKLVDNAEWTPDCQDKWDLDFNILHISTRMWGNQGVVYCFGNEKFEELREENAEAQTTVYFGEKIILESPYIEGKTNDECKKNVKKWLKSNYKNIFTKSLEQHDAELKAKWCDEMPKILADSIIEITQDLDEIEFRHLETIARNFELKLEEIKGGK